MENKKLLKFLLKDLGELEELITEKGDNNFDDLELEFMSSRLSGAKKMVHLLYEKENSQKENENKYNANIPDIPAGKYEVPNVKAGSLKTEVEKADQSGEMHKEKIEKEPESLDVVDDVVENVSDQIEPEDNKQKEIVNQNIETAENIELHDEEAEPDENIRLGDSFLKEKSVNELIGSGNNKLEHKLSNRPVTTIQSAIGINDRFQYIRELFEGDAEQFNKTVEELDKLDDIKKAVTYLQKNYKWKKNETSLKFVNLVKRRFSNE